MTARLRFGGVLVAVLALPLLVLLWRAGPAAAPPMYEGLCPTVSYRQLGGSPAPESASATFAATSSFQPAEVITREPAPQAQLLMTTDTFVSSAPFTVSVSPVAPPAPPPAGLRVSGNAYRVQAVTTTGEMLQPRVPVTVVLLAPSAPPVPDVYVYTGGAWGKLQSFAGSCVYSVTAVSKTLGYFALMLSPSSPESSSDVLLIGLVIALIVVVIACAAGLYLINRRTARGR